MIKLVAAGLWQTVNALIPGKGNAPIYLPVIKTNHGMEAICPMSPCCAEEEYIESYNVAALVDYMHGSPARSHNVKQRLVYLSKQHDIFKKPGRKTPEHIAESEAIMARKLKLQAHETAADNLLVELQALQRQTRQRDSGQLTQQADDSVVLVKRTYRSHHDSRGRRYVAGVGAQSFSKALLHAACPGLDDFDIQCCVFTLLVQILDRLQVKCSHALADFTCFRSIAANRDNVISEVLGLDGNAGKDLLNSVASGSSNYDESKLKAQGISFLDVLKQEARILRWLACTLRPELYKKIREDVTKHWPEATLFHYLWTPAEDYCLGALVAYAKSKPPLAHISCHFDGVLIDGYRSAQDTDAENFASNAQRFVKHTTGYSVKIVHKQRSWFFNSVMSGTSASHPMSISGLLLAEGNCIPLAIAHLLNDYDHIGTMLNRRIPVNTAAQVRKVRTYNDWAHVLDHILHPSVGLSVKEHGMYLLHAESNGKPHCIGCRCSADGACTVYDGDVIYALTLPELQAFFNSALDTSTVVTFHLVAKGTDTAGDAAAALLLHLQAGARSSKCKAMKQEDDITDDEADVNVGEEVRHLMDQEIQKVLDGMPCKKGGNRSDGKRGTSRKASVCPFCPFRRFGRTARLRDHVKKHHVKAKQFVASGTKQLRVISALYDNDTFSRKLPVASYLARSAKLLCTSIKPALAKTTQRIDEHIRLLIDEAGPTLINRTILKKKVQVRRVGNFYYTQAFGEAFFKSILLSHGSFRDAAAKFIMQCQSSVNELASMIPSTGKHFWFNVAEDVFSSPQVQALDKDLNKECEDHSEFTYISIDATVKCCMGVLGQSSYKANKAARANQPIPEEEAAHKVLTVRGRTSATLLVQSLQSEASSHVAQVCEMNFTYSQRCQVKHIASDNPSDMMYVTLKKTFPNLRSIGLDACHLVMIYEQTQWHKTTEGSKWLKRIMAKFAKCDSGSSAQDWGPFYTGSEDLNATAEEDRWREALLEGDISVARAKRILEAIDVNAPWFTRIQYMEAIGALCALYPSEVCKKTATGKPLRHILMNAVTPAKVEWLLNDTRFRHECSKKVLKLLPSGTTSNESLHHELHVWFRDTCKLHKPTLELKLVMFRISKLLAHNSALYVATQRQMSQKDVLHRVLGSMSLWTPASWSAWCRSLKEPNGYIKKSLLPLARQKVALAVAIKARKMSARPIYKRPARATPAPPPANAKRTRRTAFSLRRLRPLKGNHKSK